MALLSTRDRKAAEQVVALAMTNPFLPERIDLERQVLKDRFVAHDIVWSHHAGEVDDGPNFHALMESSRTLACQVRSALQRQRRATEGELGLYEDLVSFLLYYEFRDDLQQLMNEAGAARPAQIAIIWKRYRAEFAAWFEIDGYKFSPHITPAHLFALGFQLRRAFDNTFYFIIGQSLATAGVRASIWQSIFTHDMRRHNRGLYRKLDDYVTLIVGPSGTGKELVARAIGMSRYIPFNDQKLEFAQDYRTSFCPVNLSALPSTLIESELFGHCRGSFTGATEDRCGWFESCPEHGAVFLDEIGDLDGQIQVKLLRLFENRIFHRLGETSDRRFLGKVIAATNRDLAEEIQLGRFRQDFYYRICSDMIATPRLCERIGQQPEELRDLVRFLAQREAAWEVDELTEEVLQWIDQHLGREYPWPGNIRELEQCMRNVLIRQRYQPLSLTTTDASHDPQSSLCAATENVTLTAEELLRRYCCLAFETYGSYEAAAERLGIDRRTLRRRVGHP